MRSRVLAGPVALQVAVLFMLHAAGGIEGLAVPRTTSAAWLASATVEGLVGPLARLVALALAWWVLLSTLLYARADADWRRRFAPLTAPLARRLVERALPLAVAASTLTGPAALAQPPSQLATLVVPPPLDDVLSGPAETVDPAPDPASGALLEGFSQRAPGDGDGPATGPTTHTVVAGEHLWGIAAARVGGEDVRRVHAYWLRLISANVADLRSHDPDLIYPGEVLLLPGEPP